MDKISPIIIKNGSSQLDGLEKLNRLSDRYLIADDLFNIRERLIGSGQIGGKAVGMLLARCILQEEQGKTDFSRILEEFSKFTDVVNVIEIPSGVQVVVDPKTRNAVCFLE